MPVREFNWVACVASPKAYREIVVNWLKSQNVFESAAAKEPPPSRYGFPDKDSGEAWIQAQKDPSDWLLLPAISLSTLLMSTSLPKPVRLGAWARTRIKRLRRVPVAIWSTSPYMAEASKELLRGQPEWFLVQEEFDTLEREAQRLRGQDLIGRPPLEKLFRAALDFDRVLRRIYPALPVPILVVFYKSYQLRMHLDELGDELEKSGADKFACAAALRQIKALLSDYGDELLLLLPRSEALNFELPTCEETPTPNSKAAVRRHREHLLESFRKREQQRLRVQRIDNTIIYRAIPVSKVAFYAWLKNENNSKKDTPGVCTRIENFLRDGHIPDETVLASAK